VLIIYGTKIYGKKDEITGWGRCEQCGVYGQHSSYNGRKFGHIYYIPLIPSGPHLRVIKECGSCKCGMHIPELEVPEMVHEIRQTADAALAALVSGKTEFSLNGSNQSENCLGALYGPIELLLCCDEKDHVNHILQRLKETKRDYEQHLITGAIQQFNGDPQAAAQSYETAAQHELRDTLPRLLAGEMWFAGGEPDRALEAYRQASMINPNDLDAVQGMIDAYTVKSDHWNVAEMYERAFSIVPDLRLEKKIVKAYKKTCRKANRQPQLA